MPFFAERCTRPFGEKPGGEGWLVSSEQQLLCQFKAAMATDHAQGVRCVPTAGHYRVHQCRNPGSGCFGITVVCDSKLAFSPVLGLPLPTGLKASPLRGMVKKLPCRVCGKPIELSEVAAKYAAGSAVHAVCVQTDTSRNSPSLKSLTGWLDRLLNKSRQ